MMDLLLLVSFKNLLASLGVKLIAGTKSSESMVMNSVTGAFLIFLLVVFDFYSHLLQALS
jgi:hypothetical protein